jgi:hypothetical protein
VVLPLPLLAPLLFAPLLFAPLLLPSPLGRQHVALSNAATPSSALQGSLRCG